MAFQDVPTACDGADRAAQGLGGLLLTQAQVPDEVEQFPVIISKSTGGIVQSGP